MNSARLTELQNVHGFEAYRKKQIQQAFFRKFIPSFEEISTIPLTSRRQMAETTPILTVTVAHLKISSDRRAYKAVLRLRDGLLIETVLLNPKPDLWSCCISSQVGCAMKCTFCATGTMGYRRHLSNEEITDQVLFWLQYIKKNAMKASLRNIVYMGMGEPFHNKKEVFLSLTELCNPDTFNFGARHISVSTSGLAPVIYEFTERFPQVNLAISLHAPNDELRQRLMPVNKAYPLTVLLAAINHYLNQTNRKVFIEYVLLEDENDGPEQAMELVKLFADIPRRHLIHVNLIPYNKTASQHREATSQRANTFRALLKAHQLHCTIRKNLGRDIDGACGQLVVESTSTGEITNKPKIG